MPQNISLTDGNPFAASGLEYDTNTDRLLAAAWRGEKQAISVYRNIFGKISDDGVKGVLARILADEEHHERLFRELMADAV